MSISSENTQNLRIRIPPNEYDSTVSPIPTETSPLTPSSPSQIKSEPSKIFTISKKCLSAVAASLYALTVGLVISAVCSLVLAPKLVYDGLRSRSVSLHNRWMTEHVEPMKSMMYYNIRKRNLPRFKKPTEDQISRAKEIAQSTQAAEFQKFKAKKSIQYTIASGALYSLPSLFTPLAYIGLTGFSTYTCAINTFKKLNN
jgi:hypothetical protein